MFAHRIVEKECCVKAILKLYFMASPKECATKKREKFLNEAHKNRFQITIRWF